MVKFEPVSLPSHHLFKILGEQTILILFKKKKTNQKRIQHCNAILIGPFNKGRAATSEKSCFWLY